MARGPRSSKRERQDAYETVTARITAALERDTVPWRAPWRARGHRNALSGRPYRGINLLVLGLTALERDFDDARWLTYRQAASRGGHVRRGERGTRVVLWKWIEREEPEAGELVQRYPLLRLFTLFNVAQCDELGLPAPEAGEAFDPVERAEAIVSGYADGPAIFHDAAAAYYRPSRDEVHLPPREAFSSAGGYYATAFHELGHSTGHPSRLGRAGYESGVAAFGSETYSREELVAEFTAAFLSHEAGIDPSHLDQSAAYIGSWLHALRDDHRMVIVAAGLGQRAADHILGRSPETSNETSKED
jgi:antirestriction protein ArdC